MARLLSILVLVVLILSHGSMSEAMPHANGSVHGVTADHDHSHGMPARSDKNADAMTQWHAHCWADVAPGLCDEPPMSLATRPLVAVAEEQILTSRIEAPPIKPPAA